MSSEDIVNDIINKKLHLGSDKYCDSNVTSNEWSVKFEPTKSNSIIGLGPSYYFNNFIIFYKKDIQYCDFLKTINTIIVDKYDIPRAKHVLEGNWIYNYISLNDNDHLVLTYVIFINNVRFNFTIDSNSVEFKDTFGENGYTKYPFTKEPNETILDKHSKFGLSKDKMIDFLENLYDKALNIFNHLCGLNDVYEGEAQEEHEDRIKTGKHIKK